MTRVGDGTGSPPADHEEQLLDAMRQIETLRRALVSRAVIDQAKGILMALQRIGPDTAFEVLSSVSQAENVKVSRLAETLVAIVAQQQPVADGESERIVRTRLLDGSPQRSATGDGRSYSA